MTDYTTPGRLAEIDQDRAELNRLTDMVRGHHATDCVRPEFCPGADAAVALPWNDTRKLAHLLMLALADRAKTPEPHAWP